MTYGNYTGIVVSYCTKDLLQRAVDSMLSHCDRINLIIVDGSPYDNKCYKYVQNLPLTGKRVKIIQEGKNVGHGKGIEIAMNHVRTEKAIIFDSDIEVLKNPLDELRRLCTWETYGAGLVCQVNDKGVNVEKGIPYLHPYFCMVNKPQYDRFHKPIHHGAPFIKTMIDLANTENSPRLAHIDLSEYVKHDWRGTRKLNPKEFLPKYWQK